LLLGDCAIRWRVATSCCSMASRPRSSSASSSPRSDALRYAPGRQMTSFHLSSWARTPECRVSCQNLRPKHCSARRRGMREMPTPEKLHLLSPGSRGHIGTLPSSGPGRCRKYQHIRHHHGPRTNDGPVRHPHRRSKHLHGPEHARTPAKVRRYEDGGRRPSQSIHGGSAHTKIRPPPQSGAKGFR